MVTAGKRVYLLYFFSCITFVFLNNVYQWITKCILLLIADDQYIEQIRKNIVSPGVDLTGSICTLESYTLSIQAFAVFTCLKGLLPLTAMALRPGLMRTLLSEISISYLLWDIMFVLLYLVAVFFSFNPNYYFFSGKYQFLLSYAAGLPVYIVPLTWSLLLLAVLIKTRYMSAKAFAVRFGLAAMSLALFVLLMEVM